MGLSKANSFCNFRLLIIIRGKLSEICKYFRKFAIKFENSPCCQAKVYGVSIYEKSEFTNLMQQSLYAVVLRSRERGGGKDERVLQLHLGHTADLSALPGSHHKSASTDSVMRFRTFGILHHTSSLGPIRSTGTLG